MPSAYTPSIVPDFTRVPQIIEETTLGTTPSTPNWNTFGEIGKIRLFNVTHDTMSKRFRILGSEDLYTSVKNGEAFAVQMEYYPVNDGGATPQMSKFMKYLLTARGGGAGTIDRTFSMLWANKYSGTVNYEIGSMGRINSGFIEVTPEQVIFGATIIFAAIAAPTATPPSGETVLSASTTDPPVGATGGSNPLTHNSLNYDCPRFRLEVARNLHTMRVNGNLNIIDNPATRREITGDFDIVGRKDAVLKADAKSHVKRSMTYTLRSAATAVTITLGNTQLFNLVENYDGESTEVITEPYRYVSQTVSIT
jgi:hypothetical protein